LFFVVVAVLGGFRTLERAWQKVFWKSIKIYKNNKTVNKYQVIFLKCGRDSCIWFVGVKVSLAA